MHVYRNKNIYNLDHMVFLQPFDWDDGRRKMTYLKIGLPFWTRDEDHESHDMQYVLIRFDSVEIRDMAFHLILERLAEGATKMLYLDNIDLEEGTNDKNKKR